jgi:pilus assembly protein CpaB
MFKRRAFVLFVLAVGLGVGATWQANRWIQSRLLPQSADASTAQVVVAAMEIPFGQEIEASHLKAVAWPRGTEPAGSFQEVAQVEGKIANQKIVQNEVVIAQRVVDQVEGSTLAAIIEPKKRAVTVRVNDVVGVAGFLLPGNRVDVIAARKDSGRGRALTTTILENLKVLAVDQTASPEKDKPVVVRAVTLEMDTKQAERLVKATEEGTVQLTLRNPLDDSRAPVAAKKPEQKAEPQAVAVAPAPRRAAPRVDAVTVIRGTSVHVSKVKL